LLARPHFDARAAAETRDLVARGANWEALRRDAWRHQVGPLVSRNLARVAPALLPSRVLAEFRLQAELASRWNESLAPVLVEVIERLEAAGVRALAFKGPALALMAYGDLARRAFMDMDVLVSRADLATAVDVLRAAGFEHPLGGPAPDAVAGRAAVADTDYHVLERRTRGAPFDQARVDLQSGILGQQFWYSLDRPAFTARTVTISVAGSPIRTLAPDALLLALAVHGGKHLWLCLKWVCDVAGLTAEWSAPQWGRAAVLARALGLRRMVAVPLLMARDLLDAPIPPAVLRTFGAGRVAAKLAAEFTALALGAPIDGDPLTPGIELVTRYLGLRERWRDRAGYCWDYAWPKCRELIRPSDRDRAWIALPPSLAPLYGVVRPVRLALTYWRLPQLRRVVADRWRSLR
jgi:hypothetical protein